MRSPADPTTPRRRRLGALALVLALVLGAAGCGALDEQERRWVFQPSKESWGGGRAAAGIDDAWIDFRSRESDSPVRLHALWLPQARADAPVLLYLHGARWDVRSSAGRMRRMHDLGFSVLGIDYRGFGESTDVLPSESFAAEDARAAWDWLAARHPDARRYVYGHSLGGAIAVRLAADAGADGLIVEGGFTSIPDVLSTFRYGWLPLGPFVTQRFDAGARIGEVRMPVLVVHGGADGTIAPELGRALYERAPAPKRFVLVDGGSHHNAGALGAAAVKAAVRELFGVGAAERSAAVAR